MATHLLLMPITGTGADFANRRQPKYAAQIDQGWSMCDGGSFCTVFCGLSVGALATILANADVVELLMSNIKALPDAATLTKATTLLTGLTITGQLSLQQLARIAVENAQPSLIGKPILAGISAVGVVY